MLGSSPCHSRLVSLRPFRKREQAVPGRIEDYALIGDTPDRRARRQATARSTGCACPASTPAPCFAALLGDARARPLAARPGRRGPRASSRRYRGDTLVLETDSTPTTASSRSSTSCRSARRRARHRADRRGRVAAGSRCSMELVHPLRLRLDRAVGAQRRRRGSRRSPGPTRLRSARAVRHRRRGPDDASPTFIVAAGERCRSSLTLAPVARGRRRRRSTRRGARATTEGWWQEWVGALHLRRATWRDAVLRSLITLKALTYAPTRRHRRRADHVAARVARRRAQLGLPLLLAARRRRSRSAR